MSTKEIDPDRIKRMHDYMDMRDYIVTEVLDKVAADIREMKEKSVFCDCEDRQCFEWMEKFFLAKSCAILGKSPILKKAVLFNGDLYARSFQADLAYRKYCAKFRKDNANSEKKVKPLSFTKWLHARIENPYLLPTKKRKVKA